MTDDEREFFEERAGIREYEGGMSRRDAERAARVDVERYYEAQKSPLHSP